jgi:signal transduction histidine kinase
LEKVSEALQLTIRDHGMGFDPSKAMYENGIGLISMRERVTLLKGTMSIWSEPQAGTEIKFRIPLVAEHSG